MPAYRDRRSGVWRYRKRIRLPDGSRPRIEGTPSLNTKLAAEKAERAHIERALRGEPINPPKEVPTFAEFAETFMATYARSNNKPSEYEGKRSILTRHLLPAFGPRRLEEITGKDIEDLKARLLDAKRSAKRINNVLNVLSKILRYAAEIELARSNAEDQDAEGSAPEVRLLHVRRARGCSSPSRPLSRNGTRQCWWRRKRGCASESCSRSSGQTSTSRTAC